MTPFLQPFHMALSVIGLGLVACGPAEPEAPATTTGSGTSPSQTATTPPSTGTGTSTGTTLPVDCSTLPSGPLPRNLLTGLYAAEDLAFDNDGHVISHYQNALFKQEYPPGDVTAFATTDGGPGGPASLRMLQDGDLVYANVDTATLYRVTMDGQTTPLNSSLAYAMGIDIHMDGSVYLSDILALLRIDPDTGETVKLTEQGDFNYANGIAFSADYRTLFLGTRDGVMQLPLDDDGLPTGPGTLFATTPMDGEILGMAVDQCDNVYAIWEGTHLYRWTADGQGPEVLIEASADAWMTNLQFGSGLGGWEADRIYITDRNTSNPAFYELEAGVGDKPR